MARKILFAGTPDIAVPSLRSLAADPDIEILGALCPPDKKIGRKQILTPCAVKKAAQDLNIPVFEVKNKTDVLSVYKELCPELVVVIALGVIFPAEALTIAPTVNVHFSLLPKWRGASPVQSAILNGDTISGITLQKMVPTLDAGDILWQHTENITDRNTAELWDSWAHKSAQALPGLVKNSATLTPVPQEEKLATHCGKFEKADGEIFPERESAESIWRKYRAFNVWPGIFMMTSDGVVKIIECSLNKTDHSVELTCSEGSLWLQKVQLSGKSVTLAVDIVRGRPDIFRRR
jgi:methionyl-tRNA formyltransferase